MCTVCGCEGGQSHSHEHDHDHHHDPAQEHGTQTRLLRLEADILGKNARHAAANRAFLADRNALALNLVSSPGSGKTTLLVETLKALGRDVPAAVIEGDQQTERDAERIRATGAPAVQINTGKGCHLDAHMVGHALADLPLENGALLFIENVGNLVCPAGFDLGEAKRVVILSVTEGDDKPLKYPDIFASADMMVLTKTDLLPHVDFCVGAAIANARRINPEIGVLQLSARCGDGLGSWLDWVTTLPRRAGADAGLAAE